MLLPYLSSQEDVSLMPGSHLGYGNARQWVYYLQGLGTGCNLKRGRR